MKSSSSSTSSSAHLNKPSAAPKGAVLARRKKLTNARVPLQGLNGDLSCSNGINASSFHSPASTSIEAPRGCLRFFLSISSSAAKAKAPLSNRAGAIPGTPNSAPASKPRRKPNPTKCKGKSRTCSFSSNVEANSMTEKQGVEPAELDLGSDGGANCIPANKIPSGSGLGLGMHRRVDENSDDNETKIKTPPIEASVSPEIQCGVVSSTARMASGTELLPPCYGAGHVLSGITDNRKCKPRGILTVIDNDPESNLVSSIFGNVGANEEDKSGAGAAIGQGSGLSPVPIPCEALMHWLSPCQEEGGNNQKSKSPAQRLQELVSESLSSSSLPLSGTGFSSDASSNSCLSGSGNSGRLSSAATGPLRGLLDFKGSVAPMNEMPSPSHMTPIFASSTSKEGRKCSFYDEQEENVFSTGSFGSGNVIQTPHSDSASKNRENQVDSEADWMARAFDKVTLSPEQQHYHLSTWDPADLSFRLECLNTPCNSIDLAQVQKFVDSKAASWVSNCTSDFVPSQDPLRISWRDGLVSRIFEMDEFDCCRCFSDDEEEEDSNSKPHHSSDQSSGFRDNTKPGAEQMIEMDCRIQNMSLESITSDEDRLISSDDSNWNLCYKNRLFEG